MTQVAPGTEKPVDMNAVVAALMKAVEVKNAKPKRGKKAKGQAREKLTDAQRDAYKAANDVAAVEAFTKAGFKDVQPRVNVLTYGKIKADGTKTGWLAQGRKVKKGEKAIRVGPFALFHESQTEVLAA